MTRKTTRKKPAGRLPALRIHKQSGRCYGTFNGATRWFGHKDDPTTRERFDTFLAAWLARGRKLEEPKHDGITVRQLVARYLRHMEAKHGDGWTDGRLSGALDVLERLFGTEPAADFSPLRLKACRQAMVTSGNLCRSEVNARTQAIRRCFRFGCSEELVPTHLPAALASVESLSRGEFGVREGTPRGPVPEADVFETLRYLHPMAAAIVELLWWTGARPSEVLNLCPRDVDRSGAVWGATIREHKNSKRGKTRELDFGPNAQRVLQPSLDRVPRPAPDKPIFNPERAMAEHRAERRAKRETPLYPSHVSTITETRGNPII